MLHPPSHLADKPHETDELLETRKGPPTTDDTTPSCAVVWSAASAVLILTAVDWVTCTGVSQAFKNFMEDRLMYTKVTASAVRSTWTSFCDIVPLLGAYIGDEILGVHATVAFAGFWYVGGILLLAVSAHPYVLNYHHSTANMCFLVSLFGGLAIGNGCLGPTLVTLGADQFDESDPAQELYFSHYYIAINIGSTVAYSYLSYLCIHGIGTLVPSTYGYFATYLLCACLMLVAVLFFVSTSSSFVKKPCHPESFTHFFKTVATGATYHRSLVFIVAGFLLYATAVVLNVSAIIVDPNGDAAVILTYVAGMSVFIGSCLWIVFAMDNSYLDTHPTLTRSAISDTKQMLRVLPFASFLVIWQCIYDQQDANFQSITQQCDLRLGAGRNATQVPGAFLGVFDTVGVGLAILFLDSMVLPRIEHWRRAPVSPYEKVLSGLVLAGVAMFWTGIVETWRRDSGMIDLGDGLGPVLDDGTHKPMNNLSWVYAIPSYMLVAFAEVLVNIPAYDIFNGLVPPHLRNTSQAINSFLFAMGDMLASIFTLLFAAYIPDDLNQGRLEYMYFCMAGVAVLNVICFRYVMCKMQFAMTRNFVAERRAAGDSKLQLLV
ncbi:Aste57867_10234 [Aphanomyces stellatus]|uniref:Aste57867_10234 protein n=1 Tax=Aphanomyces stellatus TaxID=120398 RepID=A0A485KQD3_9STRA|nr:hypothetical protein As57867_010195 [Aphanomyces stellatus]VFT87109.1 Aste57867_10234 [Aphanomyces stellatus]